MNATSQCPHPDVHININHHRSGDPRMESSMLKPSATQLRQLRRDNLKFPVELAPIPQPDWPVFGFSSERNRIAVLRSRQFLVQVFSEGDGALRLSVNRTEWDERRGSWREDISWDDLQRLKSEAGYADRWAVEIFPADAAVVNVANMRHIWIVPEAPSFAWNVRQREAA